MGIEDSTIVSEMTKIIVRDFSDAPSGRYRTDGPYSGEAFREDVLVPALGAFARVEIDLDGPRGYPSSFVDEAFAGVLRSEAFGKDDVQEKIFLLYTDSKLEPYISTIVEALKLDPSRVVKSDV